MNLLRSGKAARRGRTRLRVACLAVCVAALFALPAAAAAAPVMQLKSSASRGPLGNDVQMSLAASFTGTEYGGFPSPLSGLTFRLPFGVGTFAGIATCEKAELEPTGKGPNACPNGSRAGRPGSAEVYVAFGKEIVPERATTEAFYGPEHQIFVFVFGHEPVLFEDILTGTVGAATPPYAATLHFLVPTVETVRGAQLASTGAIAINIGTPTEATTTNGAFKLPSSCPTPSLELAGEANFASGETDALLTSVGCVAATAPPPILGRREGATVTQGTVLVRVRGSSKFVPLSGAGEVPDGSELDTTTGTVEITAATPSGGAPQAAEVHGGVFLVHQPLAGAGSTDFALTGALTGCRRGRAATSARHSHSRHLWVSEHGGKWSTKGRYVSTSVEGTTWLTTDTCASSVVTVAAGRVAVRDLLHHRTRIISAGHSLAVRPGRHGRR